MAVSGTIYPTWIDVNLLKTCPSYDAAFLGRGAFGAVVKAFVEDHNRTVAVKLINAGGNNFDDFISEVTKLSAVLTCENIITPLAWFTYAGWAGIVMEYAECGNLQELLHTRRVNLPLCLKSRILYELLSGINYLHRLGNDQRLLHLDLKPQNILFDADLHVKISDLGGSVWSNLTEDFTRSTMGSDEGQTNVYSLAYCAPERLRHSNRRPTSKADIYSFGLLTWQVITQRKPYEDFTSRDELKNFVIRGGRCALSTDFIQQQGALDGQLARHAESLIRRCWQEDPTKRQNALEIIQQFHQVFPFSQREASASATEILQSIPEKGLSPESATASFLDITGLNRIVHPENLLHPVPVTTDTSSNQDTNSAPSTQDSPENPGLAGNSGRWSCIRDNGQSLSGQPLVQTGNRNLMVQLANTSIQNQPATAHHLTQRLVGAYGGSNSGNHGGNNIGQPIQRAASVIQRTTIYISYNRQVMRIDGKDFRVTFQRERRFQCDIVFLCYAGTDRRSLCKLKRWKNEYKQSAVVLRISSGEDTDDILDEGCSFAAACSLSHHTFPTFRGSELEQKQAYEYIFISALSAVQKGSKSVATVIE